MDKRRDKKGRVLNRGESQEQSGIYVYKYIDNNGKRKTVRSWRLTTKDPQPEDKARCEPLREIEKRIQKELDRGLVCDGITVIELIDMYLSTKTTLRATTHSLYQYMRNIVANDMIANKQVKDIKTLDAKRFIIRVKEDRNFKKSSLGTLKGIISPAFQEAVEDDIILKNPFNFALSSICSGERERRQALTEEQQKKFLSFIKNSGYYQRLYDPIFILFETGLRISELSGLTKKDVDLEHGEIDINHQLCRVRGVAYVDKPKTADGKRIIPINREVVAAFKRILASRESPTVEPMIDGYTGFIFLNGSGKPIFATEWDLYFKNICKAYNRLHAVQIPKVTPHICRHIFCSNLVAKGVSFKVIQYLMGHSDINMTLGVYAHTNIQNVRNELRMMDESYSITVG